MSAFRAELPMLVAEAATPLPWKMLPMEGLGGRGERGSCSAHVHIKDLQCYRRLL